MVDISHILDAAEGTTWEPNEWGLWCPVCGWHVAAPHMIDEDYRPPEICRDCGHETDVPGE